MKTSTFGTLVLTCAGLSLAATIPRDGDIKQSADVTIAARASATAGDNGITTPVPFQSDMVDDCDMFYYVQPDDRCQDIAATYGISWGLLRQWNPSVGSACTTLLAFDHVCVGRLSQETTNTTSCSTTTATKVWGNNRQAALAAAEAWCNDKTSGPVGKFGVEEKRTGCINAPSGQDKFTFEILNLWGTMKGVAPGQCRDMVQTPINTCNRSGVLSKKGWRVSASMTAGSC